MGVVRDATAIVPVGTHADMVVDYDVTATEKTELEVRWMTTGDLVCVVPLAPNMCISEVKQLVQERAGIPASDQRLLRGVQELAADAAHLGNVPLLLVQSAASDPRATDLGHFRTRVDFEALPRGEFTLVQKLAEGIHGDVFRYHWQQATGEQSVAVKKLRSEKLLPAQNIETDERAVHMQPWKRAPDAEDALTEIGVLSYLARQPDVPQYLLRMHGVFADDGFAWLVTEFAEGGELFDVAAAGCTNESQLQRYMCQLFQAVAFLHKHHIGHRDISLENILLKGGDVRLMDFGMSVCSHSSAGVPLRFFRAVGKDSYRAPEMYVPTTAETKVVAPSNCNPGAVAMARTGKGYLCEVRLPPTATPGQQCMAEVWGYAAQPADVFACGVCLFILAWRSPPWRTAVLSDASFAFIRDHGMQSLLRHWQWPLLSPQVMHLLERALSTDPAQRPSAAACLADPWLAESA
mmetsp:Transcript_35096/g.81494  ORF Transcript_35096/g.81494 Transcript_35096/m.81494 type:complete len:464 (-) Transcript_35096:124-1515(-)